MTKEEMIQYLLSTGLYKNTESDLFYPRMMMDSDEVISISELTERFIEIDKEFNGEPWNIKQILANIDIIVPKGTICDYECEKCTDFRCPNRDEISTI